MDHHQTSISSKATPFAFKTLLTGAFFSKDAKPNDASLVYQKLSLPTDSAVAISSGIVESIGAEEMVIPLEAAVLKFKIA